MPVEETQKTWVWSPVWEDPLEEEMATHSGILAWKILWIEEPGGLQSIASQSRIPLMQLSMLTHALVYCIFACG